MRRQRDNNDDDDDFRESLSDYNGTSHSSKAIYKGWCPLRDHFGPHLSQSPSAYSLTGHIPYDARYSYFKGISRSHLAQVKIDYQSLKKCVEINRFFTIKQIIQVKILYIMS